MTFDIQGGETNRIMELIGKFFCRNLHLSILKKVTQLEI